jgi:TetR/AcrR family transcriptional repressor of nem operon
MEQLLDQFDSARAVIRHLLEDAIPASGEEGRGCFVANATVERGHCDEDTRERACESLSRMHDGFRTIIEHGQAQGEFSPDQEAEAMAHFLANTYFGMQTMAKLDLPTSVYDDVVEGALRALE